MFIARSAACSVNAARGLVRLVAMGSGAKGFVPTRSISLEGHKDQCLHAHACRDVGALPLRQAPTLVPHCSNLTISFHDVLRVAYLTTNSALCSASQLL